MGYGTGNERGALSGVHEAWRNGNATSRSPFRGVIVGGSPRQY